MTDITEQAQRNELLIANGQQIADLLRHLADNEIDSDYFAVVSECESYGQETDAELSITEFALRAAGYVDELVEALEDAQQRITQLESRTVAVKLPQRYDLIGETDGNCSLNDAEMTPDNDGVYLRVRDVREMLTAAGIKVEAE
ncbi:hypothetical protein RW673_25640 [Klebsiella pneumoniae]|nr:hypothetical protein [Klebsiella pneumoniae]MDU9201583.1 hypothetical protein [Klebsiella pneumoniae]